MWIITAFHVDCVSNVVHAIWIVTEFAWTTDSHFNDASGLTIRPLRKNDSVIAVCWSRLLHVNAYVKD